MADLDQQIHGYATGLVLGPALDPDEIVRAAGTHRHPDRNEHRGAFLMAAVVLVVLVIGAALIALRHDRTPPPTPPAGPTVVPQSWSRTATIDGAQPSAMAASDRGVVLAGYGTWWSADGTTWEQATVDGLDGANPAFPGSISDVVATADGFLAVGVGGDKQPAVWRSETGREWARVNDPDLELPTGAIPSSVSTAYGSISSVAVTGDGLVAVGQVFDGIFSGETLTSASPFVPAIWTSPDGVEWTRATSIPPGPGTLTSVADTSHGTLALGYQANHTITWKRDSDRWTVLGQIDGRAGQLAEVGGRLVAAGSRDDAGQSALTVWSSEDGRTWEVAHEAPAANIASFTALVPDGEAVLALGYSGPYEIEAGPLALSSTDGLSWTALPTVYSPGLECSPAGDGQSACTGQSAYPMSAVVLGGELLLGVQEAVTGPGVQSASVTRLRTAIYRASDSPDTGDTAPQPAR